MTPSTLRICGGCEPPLRTSPFDALCLDAEGMRANQQDAEFESLRMISLNSNFKIQSLKSFSSQKQRVTEFRKTVHTMQRSLSSDMCRAEEALWRVHPKTKSWHQTRQEAASSERRFYSKNGSSFNDSFTLHQTHLQRK